MKRCKITKKMGVKCIFLPKYSDVTTFCRTFVAKSAGDGNVLQSLIVRNESH